MGKIEEIKGNRKIKGKTGYKGEIKGKKEENNGNKGEKKGNKGEKDRK